jgi:hypothetical protein
MINAIKRLLPGVGLIALAALVLLVADRGHRSAPAADLSRIAIFQFSSRPVMDGFFRWASGGFPGMLPVHPVSCALVQYAFLPHSSIK